MGKPPRLRTYSSPPAKTPPPLSPAAVRLRPRDYVEWKTLRRWGKLPYWELEPPGYLLRLARESAGLTQQELARRLGSSQQAVAQAERWSSNPTASFMRRWATECDRTLQIRVV
jgi:DNA-binding XRE family transcriptional regulator